MGTRHCIASLAVPAALLLLASCGEDQQVVYTPAGLDTAPEVASAVSEPVLLTTLAASWDENWYSSPAVFDINQDGAQEIIASRHSVLYVWKADGTRLWRAPVGENASSANDHGSSRMYCSPVVGDLNNDGYGEIAIAYDNQAAVYDYRGNLLPGWPATFPGSAGEIRSIAASDIDNDGSAEIVAVKTSDGPVTCVWSLSGSLKPGWPQVTSVNRADGQNDYGGYNQNIGIADLDSDPDLDIVCTYDICHIGVFHANGTAFRADSTFSGRYASSVPMFHKLNLAIQGWGQDFEDRDEFTDSPPVFADMDGDGRLEIVLFSDHERAGEYLNRGNSLWALNPDMTRVTAFAVPLTTGMPLYTGYQDNIVQVAPAPCVVTIDGEPCVVAPSYDGWMRCYGADATVRWKVQFDACANPFVGAGEAVAGDLDGDGASEIVFTTYSTAQDHSNLFVVSSSGALLHRIRLSGRGSMAAPALADVDGDGGIEIVVSLKDALGGGLGGVQIWDVPSAQAGRLDWPTGRGNYLRTGVGR